jgi:hypothetical protein
MSFEEVDDPVLDPALASLIEGTLTVPGYIDSTGLITVRTHRRARHRIAMKVSPVTSWSFSVTGGNGALIPESIVISDDGVRVVGVIPAQLIATTPSGARVWFELEKEPYETRKRWRWIPRMHATWPAS